MIPKFMEDFLMDRLPEQTWANRLVRESGMAFLEFGPLDVDRLTRLGIQPDSLGPRLVVCMWDETSPAEVGGYLVVDNLAMGRPSMGGIRMLPELTPAAIHNLARGMTLKNAAAALPYGGGKAGIVAGREMSSAEHASVVRGFAHLISRYRDIYIPGPDVGTNDADMRTVATENGLDNAVSKPVEMGGNRIDQLGAAGGGVIIALHALLEELPRLQMLPQFSHHGVPSADGITVLIQGFGAVGANAAKFLQEKIPGSKVIGVSDEEGALYDEGGLPVEALFATWKETGVVTRRYYEEKIATLPSRLRTTKYSTEPNDLLRESGFCLIPAAPVANYLDVDAHSQPSMTVDRMGAWRLVIEGANTYSPDPARKAARTRMERAVYRERGVFIATDYLVNSGGVIFAAQERLIKTPDELRLPEAILGHPEKVDRWLKEHDREFQELAERRRQAAESYRDDVIRRNMREMVELLLSDADMLPCEAAERISVRRIAMRERDRTAAEIMVPIPVTSTSSTVKEAATLLLEASSPILAVVAADGALAGVVTEWDVTRATSHGSPDSTPLEAIMTRRVISASPNDSLLEVIRYLEHNDISAVPVVDRGSVLGMINADLLARRSLLRLLQSQAG